MVAIRERCCYRKHRTRSRPHPQPHAFGPHRRPAVPKIRMSVVVGPGVARDGGRIVHVVITSTDNNEPPLYRYRHYHCYNTYVLEVPTDTADAAAALLNRCR